MMMMMMIMLITMMMLMMIMMMRMILPEIGRATLTFEHHTRTWARTSPSWEDNDSRDDAASDAARM